MMVIILAGGLGSRLSEYTHSIPKPMVLIGKKPMLLHIIEIYIKYNFNNFCIALGYKKKIVEDFFLKNINFIKIINQDNQSIKFEYKINKKIITINLVDTGLNTLTGGRVKRLKKFINNETFMLTYGDGLSNINIKDLYLYHIKHQKLVTVTAVRPPARFGALKIDGNYVINFKEKSQLNEGWINGGFFVMEPKFLDYIENDNTVLEKFPLEKISLLNQLCAFKHEGFWQCMDTKRDKDVLEDTLKKSKTEW